jgi:predicted helicase
VSSTNKSHWIERLTADYKKDMKERNIQPLSDDYIKFIRFGQHFIDKNGEGILAYISNNSFIDGIIHRQMRKHLLESFDKIYVLDLHGNTRLKEVCSDGSPDQNVFDIMAGVSINIFVKTGKKKKTELGQVFHYNLQGKRELKYNCLNNSSIKSLNWDKIIVNEPNYFFVKKNFQLSGIYNTGFKLDNFFKLNTVGVSTFNDNLTVKFSKEELVNNINIIKSNSNLEYLRNELKIKEDSRDWKLENAKNDIENQNLDKIGLVYYRPYDWRYTLHTTKSKGFIAYPRPLLVANLFKKENLALNTVRQSLNGRGVNASISKEIICRDSITSKTYSFPLYIYNETNNQQIAFDTNERLPNLNIEIVTQISTVLGLTFTNEKETTKDAFAPIDILDYIYAVLHSPTYREKYKEFLKIDFPRVPYPKDKHTFWKLVKLGGEIRQIHLLESAVVEKPISKYPHTGTNVVVKIKYENGNVYINETQCFEDVPEVAWNFFIGGYQPAQKWLKDRKDRELQIDDIRHYMKIIVALTETDRLMKEIDKIEIE